MTTYIAFSLATEESRGIGTTAQIAVDVMLRVTAAQPTYIEVLRLDDDRAAHAIYAGQRLLPEVRGMRIAQTVYRGAGRAEDGLPAIDWTETSDALSFDIDAAHSAEVA